MIQAVLLEFTGGDLKDYLERSYEIVHGNATAKDLQKTFLRVCAYHFLKMCRRNTKDICNKAQQHFVMRSMGRMVCFDDLSEMTEFVNQIATITCSPWNTKEVSDALTALEVRINNFDYSKQDVLAMEGNKSKKESHDLAPDGFEIEKSGSWHKFWSCKIKLPKTSTSNVKNTYYLPQFLRIYEVS